MRSLFAALVLVGALLPGAAAAQAPDAGQQQAPAPSPEEALQGLKGDLEATRSRLSETEGALVRTQDRLAQVEQAQAQTQAQLQARAEERQRVADARAASAGQLSEGQALVGVAADDVLAGSPNPVNLEATEEALAGAAQAGAAGATPQQAEAAQRAAQDVARAREQLDQRNYYDAQVSLANAALHAQQAQALLQQLPPP